MLSCDGGWGRAPGIATRPGDGRSPMTLLYAAGELCNKNTQTNFSSAHHSVSVQTCSLIVP